MWILAAWTFLLIQVLFVLYVFSMNVQRVWDKGLMTGWHWLFCGFWVIIAVLLDVVLNYTILAALTLDFPKKKEYTFSKRLERLIRGSGPIAETCKFVAFILDPFDPSGKHIK